MDGVFCLIPAYNAALTIATALFSCSEFERVLVYDDGSTDATASIAAGYPNVEVIGGQHVGLQAARHELYLEAARLGAEIVVYLDADDYRLPGALAAHVSLLRSSDADVLLTATCTIPRKHITVPFDVLREIVGVRFQTGSLVVKLAAMDNLFYKFGYTWRPGAYWFLEGVFAWDLYRSGASFIYSDSPGSIYNAEWSKSQYSAAYSSADRLRWLEQLIFEMRNVLGADLWGNYDHYAEAQRGALAYRVKRGM